MSSSNHSLIVAKFGGTSMGSRDAMLNAARIVLAKPATRVVVVSATSGTTNQLLKLAELKGANDLSAMALEQENLSKRHLELAHALECDAGQFDQLHSLFQELNAGLAAFTATASAGNDQALDAILSIGERLSSILFVQALRMERKSMPRFLMHALI